MPLFSSDGLAIKWLGPQRIKRRRRPGPDETDRFSGFQKLYQLFENRNIAVDTEAVEIRHGPSVSRRLFWRKPFVLAMVHPKAALPPVLPILLYNGKTPWTKPDQIEDLIDSPEGLSPYVPRFRYHLIDEGRLPENLLEPTDDPVAALFKLERAQTSEGLLGGLKSMFGTTRAPNLKSLREDLIKWVHRNVLPIRFAGQAVPEAQNLLEAPQMLAETIKTWPGKWLKEGLEQGKAEGRIEGAAEGRRNSILEVCSARGLVLSGSQRRRISDTRDLDQLRDWLIKAASADSADDIFT